MDPERHVVGSEPARCDGYADLDRLSICAPAGMDADDMGHPRVAETLAEAGADWLGDGLVDVAAQPPATIATMAATLARTTTEA